MITIPQRHRRTDYLPWQSRAKRKRGNENQGMKSVNLQSYIKPGIQKF